MTEPVRLFEVDPIPRAMLSRVSRIIPVGPSQHSTIDDAFDAFHHANPAVYWALRHLALGLISKGRDRVGIGMLYEVLRWQVQLATDDPASDLKLNNNYRSRYARLLAADPQIGNVFELRELKSRGAQ